MRWLGGLALVAMLMLAAAPAPPGGAVAPPVPRLVFLPGDDCPPPPSGIQVPDVVPFEVAADDGTALRGHVYLPRGAPRPVDVVVTLSPYWGLYPGGSGCLPVDERTDPLLRKGYAFAAMALRGTGASDGCLQFSSRLDRTDGRAIVEALVEADFSTGNVALMGGSFDGISALGAIAAGAPAKAVAVSSAGVDWWRVHTRGGATWFAGDPALPMNGVVATFNPGVGLNTFSLAYVIRPNLRPFYNVPPASHATCPIYAEHVAQDALLLRGDRNAYWDDRDFRDELAGTTVPVLFTNGMRNLEEMVLQTDGLWNLLRGEKRFFLGQWHHLGEPLSLRTVDTLHWFDHYLRGAPLPPSVPSNTVMWQDDSGAWHNSTRWPPVGVHVNLPLSKGAILPVDGTVEASEQTFTSLWANPCLGLCIPLVAAAQPPELRYQDVCGPFQALYVSPPLAERVVLAGNFRVTMTVTSSLPDGHLAAFLYQSATGQCPDPQAKEVRRAIGSLRHVIDERGLDFPVDSPTSIALQSYPYAAVVPAGQRLVLAIGGEASSVVPSASKPQLTVTTGPELPGVLSLTVVEGTLRFA